MKKQKILSKKVIMYLKLSKYEVRNMRFLYCGIVSYHK